LFGSKLDLLIYEQSVNKLKSPTLLLL